MSGFARIAGFLMAGLTCCLAPNELSAMIADMPVEWYVEKADLIILGRVVDVRVFREADFEIYTRYTIEVERTLKGAANDTVTITLFGGETADQGCWYSDRPYFEQGERVIVFLRDDRTNPVVGEMQGKYTIDDNAVFIEGLSVPQLIDLMKAPETRRWQPTGPTWQPAEMNYETNLSYDPGFDLDIEWSAAAGEWTDTPSAFSFEKSGDTLLGASLFESPYRLDGHNVLCFQSIDGQFNVLGQAAWAYIPSTNVFVESDVRFDTGESWWNGDGACPPNSFDLQSVATHELGHSLGLAHEVQQTDLCPVMKPSITTCTEYRLCQDDIDGIVALYGIPVPGLTPGGMVLCIGVLSASMCIGRRGRSSASRPKQ